MKRTLASEAAQAVGQEIQLAGWVASNRDHGGLVFIDLRDHTGIIQLTINPEQKEAFELAGTFRDEFVVKATGTVIERDASLVNPNIATGKIEVKVTGLEILNKSRALPFPVDHQGETNEELRLKYRFLDLRREKMQTRLRRKDEFFTKIREYMHSRDFTEVVTPILA